MMRRNPSARAKGKEAASSSAAAGSASQARGANREQENVDTLFNRYADKQPRGAGEPPCIGPEGVERLCADLKTDPADVKVLLLAWKLEAKQMGYFSQEEWRQGMKLLKVDTLDKLKRALPTLPYEIGNPTAFQAFFRYAFTYCLTEPRQKTVDADTAQTMLAIVAPGRRHQPLFCQFLQEQTEYQAINLDQWMAFLRFSQEIEVEFQNYDESMAWPLLYDNFVEWARSRMS
eukprot:TRINITY_DN525_c0_g1_i1.p1 TRINITY_DN525_c0_g1~~TRINITY_DN525_c0_g1_i1.p1  ORF type:complete len:232 (-),score=46.72 TRINITY_DN525_c0_g1_i1:534-1229(-)